MIIELTRTFFIIILILSCETWVSSLGQWNFDFDVCLWEISLFTVDFSLIPVLVNSLHQRDDIILLKIQRVFDVWRWKNVLKLTLNPSSPGFSGSKSYNAMQQGCCWAGCGGLAGERIGDGRGEAAKVRSIVNCSHIVKTKGNYDRKRGNEKKKSSWTCKADAKKRNNESDKIVIRKAVKATTANNVHIKDI